MAIIGSICLVIGTIISLIYGIKLLIQAFQTSILWGLGYIFVPLVSLIFIIVHWEETNSSFLKGLLAIPFLIVGTILMPSGTDGIQYPGKSNQEMHLSMNEVSPEQFSKGKIRGKVKPLQNKQMEDNLKTLNDKSKEQTELTLHKTPPVNKENKRITEPIKKNIEDKGKVSPTDDKKTTINDITAKATKGITVIPSKVTNKKPAIKLAQIVEKPMQNPDVKSEKAIKKTVKEKISQLPALQKNKQLRKPLIDVPRGSDKVKLYISLLKNKTIPWYIRNDAARELGLTGDEQAIEPLIYALQSDAHPFTRREAALALGKLDKKIALEPLARATLKDDNEWVSQYAADAIDDLISKKIIVGTHPSK